MTYLRIIFGIIVFYINTLITFSESEVKLQDFGFSLLMAYIAFALYLYGRWFSFIYSVNINRNFNIKVFEFILLPLISINIFSFPILLFDDYEMSNVLLTTLFVLSQFDVGGGIQKVYWKKRFYEFSEIPDSGFTSIAVVKKYKSMMLFFCILLPIGLTLVYG